MIWTAGGTLVCSTCGNESPSGNRFCGLCGTPLPHRPLDTPGAQGTMSLTRGPLESSQPPERQSAAVDIAGAQVPAETFGEEPNQPSDLPPSEEMVPEDPLQAFGENLDRTQLDQPEQMATADDTLAMPSDILAFADALPPVEQSLPLESPEFPWMEDVLHEIAELEAAKPSKIPDERPPFLDLLNLDELTPPTVEPEASAPVAVAPFFSEISDVPQTIAASDVTPAVEEPPAKRWRLWLATAAVLVFAALGTIQWWSHRDHDSPGLVAVIERKIRDLKPRAPADTNNDQSGMSAGSAAPNSSSPAIRTEEQSKPQDQSSAASVSVPSTAPDGKPETTKTTVPATVAAQVQSPPPTGSNSAPSQQVSSLNKTEPAQRSLATNPPAATGSSNAASPQPTAKAAPPAVEKPKAIPPDARNGDRAGAVKKAIPGNLEMTKAKEASDASDQVAWLWKATAKGNPDAPLRLADMYIKGDAVPRSCVQALVLLRTAALDDNVQACNRLASMYTVGLCVSPNHVKAYRWLSAAVAADPGSQRAQQNRDLLWQQMTPEERTLAEKYR